MFRRVVFWKRSSENHTTLYLLPDVGRTYVMILSHLQIVGLMHGHEEEKVLPRDKKDRICKPLIVIIEEII